MKKIIAVLAIALVSLASCKKEETVQPAPVKGSVQMTGRTNMGEMD